MPRPEEGQTGAPEVVSCLLRQPGGFEGACAIRMDPSFDDLAVLEGEDNDFFQVNRKAATPTRASPALHADDLCRGVHQLIYLRMKVRELRQVGHQRGADLIETTEHVGGVKWVPRLLVIRRLDPRVRARDPGHRR